MLKLIALQYKIKHCIQKASMNSRSYFPNFQSIEWKDSPEKTVLSVYQKVRLGQQETLGGEKDPNKMFQYKVPTKKQFLEKHNALKWWIETFIQLCNILFDRNTLYTTAPCSQKLQENLDNKSQTNACSVAF